MHEAVADAFLHRFRAALDGFAAGDPMAPTTTLAPLCSQAALDHALEQIDAAVQGGARVVLGGKRLPHAGCFLAPTILADVRSDNPAFRQEFFGRVAAGWT